MAARAYPDVPNFRYDWTALGEAQIQAAVDAVAANGPACASGLDFGLAGKTMQIVTDKGTTGVPGPSLSYRFLTGNRLQLSENGSSVSAGYGALNLGPVTFIAHLIPGTLRGYALAVNNDTGLATVIELWFAGYAPRKREVMREVYQGYVAQKGKDAPPDRHQFTNRTEGKGFFWRQDTGAETLEYYPSVAYTHWVELSRMDRKQGYSAPADYIDIDENLHIVTRTECEFSGIFTAYVMDVNNAKQVGLRLGFNAADQLEFYVFRGTGEWLGQIAKFEEFGFTKGGPMLPRPGPGQSADVSATSKGARGVYRPLATMPKMTSAEVDAAVAKSTTVFPPRAANAGGAAGMAGNSLATSPRLTGRNATIRYDNGPVMEYQFVSADELKWRRNGAGDWKTGRYNAWEPVPDVFFFAHALEGTKDHEGHIVVADWEHGKATCYNGYLNTPYFANEAGCRTLFGKIEAAGVPDAGLERHGFTEEMLGRCITYHYTKGLTSMHLYSTPQTTSWIIFTPDQQGGLEWCGSGAQVKIRDGLYFLYWIEEACNGTLGTILINLRTMHDAGIGYYCGPNGLSISNIGALIRHAGRFDVAKYFQQRTEESGQ